MTLLQIGFTEAQIFPMLIAGAFMLISMWVGGKLKRKFAEYSKEQLMAGLSGKEVAEKMLADNGIYDVKVISVAGQLTDHYNPMKKTVNLSEAVYNQRNAAATAVSAHECGHAIQHAKAYAMLKFRSWMVPAMNIANSILPFLLMVIAFGGGFLYSNYPLKEVLWLVVGLNAVITLFALVTLPVEFDASRRALAWIKTAGITNQREYEMSRDALKWAAMTYVVAALAAMAQLIYWVMMLLGNDD